MDPTSWGRRNKVQGRYWIDIYEAASGRSLFKVEGSFQAIGPDSFLQLGSAWYGGYLVMPLGRITDSGSSLMLQKLLVCDADAAGRSGNLGLNERK